MERLVLVIFVLGSFLFLLGASEEPTRGLFTTSPVSTQWMSPQLEPLDSSEQAELAPPELAGPGIPDFLTTSQESGFSSEENEELKGIQLDYFSDDLNDTALVTGSPGGYNPTPLQPSSSPERTASDGDSTLSLSSSEPPKPRRTNTPIRELWKEQGETTSNQSEPVHSTLPMAPSSSPKSTDQRDTHVVAVTEEDWHATLLAEMTTFPDAEGSSYGPFKQPGLLSLSTAEADTNTTPERPSMVYSTVIGSDILLDTVAMVTTMHRRTDSETPDSGPSRTTVIHAASSTLIPWNEPQGLTESIEPYFRQSLTETGSVKTELPQVSPQVICTDWSELTGKGYVILNMSENNDCILMACLELRRQSTQDLIVDHSFSYLLWPLTELQWRSMELFRVENGDRLLAMLEKAFSRKMDNPQETWFISLSKPNRQDKQLLMTLAGEQGVIPTKDVLSMLGEIRKSLYDIGIQNYTSATSCQSRPTQSRSDYGKLFVVLVIIGSICVVIIVSGLIYICWQRRLPKLKDMSHSEELHFVENGCHDNPTLDVTIDSQSEMQEKKPNVNGVAMDGVDNWHISINKTAKEQGDNYEEDTHL
ncbi:podocalyxin-like protein 2 isoform X2 [Polyodon spathula]|uniref:podocalyxin-like protein 2 isoform X2 n=1 Tax=Polyodon spathula TaxID=7913 RepID=UPI001B7E083F|nr:podocalyxin-like protein 2 isoform X2 [Polyodon spathula]